jgi:hypothetical protein
MPTAAVGVTNLVAIEARCRPRPVDAPAERVTGRMGAPGARRHGIGCVNQLVARDRPGQESGHCASTAVLSHSSGGQHRVSSKLRLAKLLPADRFAEDFDAVRG